VSGLPDDVGRFIEHHALMPPGSRGVVAVSGGVDSLVLLDVLRTLGGGALHVATLDHGLRGAAGAADADYVRELASRWGLPVTVGRADVPALAAALGIGLEDAARRARYAFLGRVARAVGADWIAVGHHAGDQAETVLMHLIRGSGLAGLGGMRPDSGLPEDAWPDDLPLTCDPPLEPVGAWRAVRVVRPLLEIERAAIEGYAAARGMIPRQDATNTDRAYLRNRTRHELIPLLESVNPKIREALVRLASVVREDAARLATADESLLARIGTEGPAGEWMRLARGAWAELSRAEQRGVLRAAVRRLRGDVHDLELDHVERALELAGRSHTGAVAVLPGGLRMRVERDALVMFRDDSDPADRIDAPALEPGQVLGPFAAGERVTWTLGGWTFGCRALEPGDDLARLHADPLAAALSVPPGAPILLRARQVGDRWLPRGMGGHGQKLKAAWQSMGVPAAWRDRVPLLVIAGEIGWFVAPDARQGLRGRVAEPFAPAGEEWSGAEARMEPGEGLNRAIIVVRWVRASDL